MFLCSAGALVHAAATVSHAGPNSLNRKVSERDDKVGSGTHLQGLHLLRLSMAVNWIAADHVLLGWVSRSKVLSSSLITPLPAAASFTSLSCSASRAAETRVSGRRRRARTGVNNIVGWIVDGRRATCLMTKKEIRTVGSRLVGGEHHLDQNIPDDRRRPRRRTHSSQAGRSANIPQIYASRRHRTRRWTEDE